MSQEPHPHDPVNALSEADASGETAEIFADIRQVMRIPLVTSIWRTLASIEDGLETAWAATRPLYLSGQPDAILQKFKVEAEPSTPAPIPIERLEAARFKGEDRTAILGIFDAYNRSNGLNLIALTDLVTDYSVPRIDHPRPPGPTPWPALPPLLPKTKISPADWELLERVKHIGASDADPALPTLWRHLIHWPDLLSLVLEFYQPLQKDGTLERAIEKTRRFAETEASSISHDKSLTRHIPSDALNMIRNYVGTPPSVTRMVTLGHSVAQWLRASLKS